MDFSKINISTAIIKNNSNKLFNDLKPYFEEDFEQTLNWLIKKKYNRRFLTQFQVFWNSDIPMHYANQLFRSKFRIHLLKHYFRQYYFHNKIKKVRLCSPIRTSNSLLKKISEIIPNDLMQVIKVGQHFLDDDHFKSFSSFKSSSNSELQMFYKVCEAFRQFHHQHEQTKRKFDTLIEKTAVEDLLIHFSLFVEKVRWEYKYQDYQKLLTKLLRLPCVMGTIIEQKLKLCKKINPKYHFSEIFDLEVIRIIRDKIQSPKKYKKFETLFEFYDSIDLFKANYLDSFCYDKNYKARIKEDGSLELSPIDINQHHNWLKIGKKYSYYMDYYLVKAVERTSQIDESIGYKMKYIGDTESHRLQNKSMIHRSLSYSFMLEDYSMLEEIETPSGQRINPYWLIHYMEMYASNSRFRFVDEVEKCYYETGNGYLECVHNVMLKQMMSLQISALPIKANSFDNLKQQTLGLQTENNLLFQKFNSNATEKQIEDSLNFFILNLNLANEKSKINFQINPILRIGNICYNISSLLGNTNITSTIINRLLPNKQRAKERNQETEKMAFKLAELFEFRGFKSIAEYKLKDENGKDLTDIDCAAYKDGVLFLVELKSTYLRANLKELLDNEYAMNKAGQQLGKIENYIKSNFEIIKNELEIDKPLEEIQLYPLIVSTTFEQDYQRFNGYRKISLLELDIILNNAKSWLLRSTTHGLKLIDKYFPDFDTRNLNDFDSQDNLQDMLEQMMDKIDISEISFYPLNANKNNVSPKYIIEAIEKDKVWDFLDDEEYPLFDDTVERIFVDKKTYDNHNRHNDLYEEALDRYHKDDFNESIELLNKALIICPNNDKYLTLRGDNYAKKGELLKSIVDLRKATEINPQNEMTHSHLALSYMEFADMQNAIKHINLSIALNRSNQEALNNRVAIRVNARFMQTAIEKDLKKIIAINPNNDFGLNAQKMLKRISMR